MSLSPPSTVSATHELAVKTAFATLLETAAKPFGWKLVPEHSMRVKGGKRIQPDGTLMDVFRLQHGHWEAKDSGDGLNKEIRKKIDLGYPTENLLFWEPRRADLYQYGNKVADEPLDESTALLSILAQFLDFAPEAIAQWEAAVAHFKDIIPTLGKALAGILKKARKENPKYSAAFDEFVVLCRGSLNPNLAEAAVEEMLVQHLLTERILREIFDIENFHPERVPGSPAFVEVHHGIRRLRRAELRMTGHVSHDSTTEAPPKLSLVRKLIGLDQCYTRRVVLAVHNRGVRARSERLDDGRLRVFIVAGDGVAVTVLQIQRGNSQRSCD